MQLLNVLKHVLSASLIHAMHEKARRRILQFSMNGYLPPAPLAHMSARSLHPDAPQILLNALKKLKNLCPLSKDASMHAASFARNALFIATPLLSAQPEIQTIHRVWADQLQGLSQSARIDIGAYLTVGRNRSVATLQAQQVMINLQAALAAAREGIAQGRLSPGKQYPSYDHLAQRGADCAKAYEKLFLCDRAYAEAHERLIGETAENGAIAQAVKNADDIVRTAVMHALATESPSIVHTAIAKILSLIHI